MMQRNSLKLYYNKNINKLSNKCFYKEIFNNLELLVSKLN